MNQDINMKSVKTLRSLVKNSRINLQLLFFSELDILCAKQEHNAVAISTIWVLSGMPSFG